MKFKPNKAIISSRSAVKSASVDLFVSRESCLMRCEIYNTWLINHGVKEIVLIPQGKTFEYYHEQASWNKFLEEHAAKLVNSARSHLKRYPLAKKKLLKSSANLARVCREGRREQILAAYKKYIEVAYDFCEYIWSAWLVIYILEPRTLPKLKNSEAVVSLDRPIEYFKMQLSAIKQPLARLVNQYSWLNVYTPFDQPYTEKDFIKIKSGLKISELTKQLAGFKNVNQRFKKILADLPKKYQSATKLIHAYTYLKTDRIDAWKKATFHLIDLCQYLSSISGITLKEASYLTVSEVINLLEGKRIQTSGLNLRAANKVVYVITKGQDQIVLEPKAVNKIINKVTGAAISRSTVKGIGASRGLAKGLAKIILHSDDVKKLKHGDVLVASYTFPSFVPFMKTCSAIVTDEGGMTSHAAIVSRELGIPCVIGTKIATKVFKDGDLVEVDAEKGIVRKL